MKLYFKDPKDIYIFQQKNNLRTKWQRKVTQQRKYYFEADKNDDS